MQVDGHELDRHMTTRKSVTAHKTSHISHGELPYALHRAAPVMQLAARIGTSVTRTKGAISRLRGIWRVPMPQTQYTWLFERPE